LEASKPSLQIGRWKRELGKEAQWLFRDNFFYILEKCKIIMASKECVFLDIECMLQYPTLPNLQPYTHTAVNTTKYYCLQNTLFWDIEWGSQYPNLPNLQSYKYTAVHTTTHYWNPVHAAIILCGAIMFDIAYNLFTKSIVQTALILYILTYNNTLISTSDFSY